MAVLDIGDRIQAVIHTRLQGQNGLMVRHYTVFASAGAARTTQHVANHLDTAFAGVVKACMSENAQYLGVSCKKINALGSDSDFAVTNDGPGTVESEPLPGQVCGLISLKTGLAGRSRRGRVYVPFPAEGHNTFFATPEAAYKTALDNFRNALIADQIVSDGGGNSVSIEPVIFSRTLNQTFAIQSGVSGTHWATQRKRASRTRGDAPSVP